MNFREAFIDELEKIAGVKRLMRLQEAAFKASKKAPGNNPVENLQNTARRQNIDTALAHAEAKVKRRVGQMSARNAYGAGLAMSKGRGVSDVLHSDGVKNPSKASVSQPGSSMFNIGRSKGVMASPGPNKPVQFMPKTNKFVATGAGVDSASGDARTIQQDAMHPQWAQLGRRTRNLAFKGGQNVTSSTQGIKQTLQAQAEKFPDEFRQGGS